MTPDPQALLQALVAARTSDGGKAALQTMLAQAAEADPTTAAVAQLLARREASSREAENERDDDATLARQAVLARRRDTIARLRSHLESLADRIATLEAREVALAHALGACPSCWGEDGNCAVCRGSGRVGWRLPDPAVFEHLIQPAVRRLIPRRVRPSVGAATRIAESQTTTP